MTDYPAKTAALKSREYVHAHNKEGWLGQFATDAKIEDPIGVSYIDPTGKGHSTPEEREVFWDTNIANSDIAITIHESYGAANECANHLTLDLKGEMDGKPSHIRIHGIFTYSVNEAGKITALRGYWQTQDAQQLL